MRSRKPRLCIVAYRRLAALARSVLPEYASFADIQLLDMSAEAALAELANKADEGGRPDVLIAASANARWLKANGEHPVTTIQVTGYDLMLAMQQARQQAIGSNARLLLVGKQALVSLLESFRAMLSIPVEVVTFQENEEAIALLAHYRQQPQQWVVVGSSIVADWAEQQGLPAVIIYSVEALKRAIEEALALAKIASEQEEKREQLHQIVKGLNEGVIAVDGAERILTMNDTAATLMGSTSSRLQGRQLSELQPLLSLQSVLLTGEAQMDQVVTIGQRRLVTQRSPMIEHGRQTGALLTFQEASRIEQADRTLRHQGNRRQFAAKYQLTDIIGDSASIRQSRELAALYAPSHASVLILGESGTGKELFAQGIHLKSSRKSQPFVAVNCAAFPENLLESELFGYEEGAFTGSRKGGKAGLIELAHRGTLFLDEIGDMPLALQTRLLRVLQEKEVLRLGANEPIHVDIRVIAATHANLAEQVQQQRFRGDLYYRLNILSLPLAPLRERAGDGYLLVQHFVRQFLQVAAIRLDQTQLAEVFWQLACNYPWPGNIRELENLVERAVVYATATGRIDPVALAAILPELQQGPLAATRDCLPPISDTPEKQLDDALAQTGGDLQATAKLLGISRTTLWRRLKSRCG